MRKPSSASASFGWFQLLLMALSGFVLLFIVAPLVGLYLNTSSGDLASAAGDPEVRGSIWLTLWVSMAGTLVFAVGAIPLAYLLARKRFRFKGLVSGIVDLPIVIPHSAAGIALLGVIARNSALGRSVAFAGEALMGVKGWSLVCTPVAVALAMAFVSLPFLINAARDGFAAVPERIERVAMNLGASPARAFFTVALPLAWRPILSGLVLMWARGMSEFGAVVIVAYHPMIAPVMIYERFTAFGLRYARPVAALFIVVCLVVFVLLRLLAGRERHVKA